jgi:hypothetical protein
MDRCDWLKEFFPRLSIAAAAFAAVTLLPAACLSQQPIQIFIFAGQSNAGGTGARLQLDPVPEWAKKAASGWTGAPTVSSDSGIQYKHPTPANSPMLYNATAGGPVVNMWCNYEGSMPAVAYPSEQPTGSCTEMEFYGPELSFLARYRQDHPAVRLAVLKLGLGGTSMLEWMPGGTPHAWLSAMISQAAQRLTSAGLSYRWAGLIWMQGENGASGTYALVDPDRTRAFSFNLRLFLSDVRKVTDAQMPVVIGRISNSMEAANIITPLVASGDCRPFTTKYTPYQACVAADELRRSEQVLVGSDPGNAWWDNDNLPVSQTGPPEHWYHFTGAGYLAMGERAYAAYSHLVSTGAGQRQTVPAHSR